MCQLSTAISVSHVLEMQIEFSPRRRTTVSDATTNPTNSRRWTRSNALRRGVSAAKEHHCDENGVVIGRRAVTGIGPRNGSASICESRRQGQEAGCSIVTTAIVTGSGGVIGASVACRLAIRDVSLVLTDASEAGLTGLRQRLSEAGLESASRQCFVAGDLTAPAFPSELVRSAVERFGQIDVCINGAGTEQPVARVTELSIDAMRSCFEVNVFALTRLSAAVITEFLREGRGGRIVNLASGAALHGAAFMSAYNASKHAVMGITRCLAREYATEGIAVNAVCPGYVESRMVTEILSRVAAITASDINVPTLIPAGRMAFPDEISNVVEYLALDAPVYLTGSAIDVDGGLYA